jgi:peptidoglycan hydrolase-like protein with peptidoglycan-binding domain
MKVLKEGAKGKHVRKLQKRLRELGFSPGAIDGIFGPATEAAVMAFQKSKRILGDGIVGPRTSRELFAGIDDNLVIDIKAESVIKKIKPGIVSKMFPQTPIDNIKENLPFILKALIELELECKNMVLMGLSTIRAETESFEPINEFQSRFNTSPGGHPFDLYDHRSDLGNQGPPDGERYRGRGFIQLTGQDNYRIYGKAIGLGNKLINKPELANKPEIAARLLSHFLKSKELAIKESLIEGNLRMARKLVNGGSHGFDRFRKAFNIGDGLIA